VQKIKLSTVSQTQVANSNTWSLQYVLQNFSSY
jgi:hypothetical protein